MKNYSGFTLLEFLLSLAVLAILTGILTPVFISFQVRNDLDIATLAAVSSLRRAEQLSRNEEGDSSWGVNLMPENIVLFKGANYSGRDTSYDEIFYVPNNITFSGTSSVVFSKLYGLPGEATAINLTSLNNENRIIEINSQGSIDY